MRVELFRARAAVDVIIRRLSPYLADFVLEILNQLPDGLLDREASRIHEVLDGPALIHIPGQKTRPLYVSVLLHGNETTGWETVRALLNRYPQGELPRSLSLFIGNVKAAKENLRYLDGQPDYNRIWRKGGEPEHAMAAAVIEEMRALNPVACIDVHNTSGTNPHHACVNWLQPSHLALASRFGHFVVYADQPAEVETRAFGEFCPAVIIECGMPDRPGGVEHALAYLQDAMVRDGLDQVTLHPGDIDLFHTAAVVKIPEDISFGFGDGSDLDLLPDLDQLNFNEMPAGTVFGHVKAGSNACVSVTGAGRRDLSERYFALDEDRLVTAVPLMPALISTDPLIVRQDCLCYLMERIRVPEVSRDS